MGARALSGQVGDLNAFIGLRLVQIISAQPPARFYGGGAIVTADGDVATCHHVVAEIPTNEIAVQLADGRTYNATLTAAVPERDLALLRIDSGGERFEYFRLPVALPELAQVVVITGFRTVQDAVVKYSRRTAVASRTDVMLGQRARVEAFGLDSRDVLSPGMSGGPVVDPSTRVLLGLMLGFDFEPDALDMAKLVRRDDLFLPLTVESLAREGLRVSARVGEAVAALNTARSAVALLGFASRIIELNLQEGLFIAALCELRSSPFPFSVVLVSLADTRSAALDYANVRRQIVARMDALGTGVDRVVFLLPSDSSSDSTAALPPDTLVTTAEDVVAKVGSHWNHLSMTLRDRAAADPPPALWMERAVLTADGPSDDARATLLECLAADRHVIFLTGLSGSGKSALLKRLYVDLADMSNELLSPLGRPMLVDMVDFASADLHERFTTAGLTLSGLQTSQQTSERLTLLLDGVDDLLMRDGYVSAVTILASVLTALPSRFAICCASATAGRPDAEHCLIAAARAARCEIVTAEVALRPLMEKEYRRFLVTTLGAEVASDVSKRIEESLEIWALARWPEGLKAICEAVVRNGADELRASSTPILNVYIETRLKGDNVRRRTSLPVKVRLQFASLASLEMNRQGTMLLNRASLRQVAEGVLRVDADSVTFGFADLLSSSLMQFAGAEGASFVDPTVLSYFLARGIASEIEQMADENGVRTFNDRSVAARRLPISVLRSIASLLPSQAPAWRTLQATRDHTFEETGYVGGNCASLLRLLGADLRGADLRRLVMRGAIFGGMDLAGTVFAGSDIRDAAFASACLTGADLRDTQLDRVDFKVAPVAYDFAVVPSKSIAYCATSLPDVQVLPLSAAGGELKSLGGFSDFVFACAVDDRRQRLAAAGQDAIIRVWDISTQRTVAVLRRHMGDVRGLRFTDAGDLVSSGVDGRLVKWCHPDYAPVELVVPQVEFWSCDITDANQCVAITTAGELVSIDLVGMSVSWRRQTRVDQTRAVAVAKAESIIFVGTPSSGVERYSLEGDQLGSNYGAPAGCFRSLSATVDGHLICAGENGRVSALDVRTGALRRSWQAPTNDHITAVGAATLDAVLAGAANGQVWLFGATGGPDGRLLVDWSKTSRFDCRAADFRGARGVNAYRSAALASGGAKMT
jgi:uncharacterized protein YjbI with pentapeptide repeats